MSDFGINPSTSSNADATARPLTAADILAMYEQIPEPEPLFGFEGVDQVLSLSPRRLDWLRDALPKPAKMPRLTLGDLGHGIPVRVDERLPDSLIVVGSLEDYFAYLCGEEHDKTTFGVVTL